MRTRDSREVRRLVQSPFWISCEGFMRSAELRYIFVGQVSMRGRIKR